MVAVDKSKVLLLFDTDTELSSNKLLSMTELGIELQLFCGPKCNLITTPSAFPLEPELLIKFDLKMEFFTVSATSETSSVPDRYTSLPFDSTPFRSNKQLSNSIL